ncbi:unnamed protein product [Ranitomeya imitator]|uniref:Uncharacterized protein n=1 Tax=Ranitomeya imitator TaxID=111125 RepID=A0ABN9LKP0_9NEOB|nr:unnamed protein product [Ranitomeya imitator]
MWSLHFSHRHPYTTERSCGSPNSPTSVTIRSSVKMSSRKEIKKNLSTKTESSTLIADSQVSTPKHGSNTEVFKPTPIALEKREKPKHNVEPLPVKVATKQKAQERTIVAEVKPMSSALTCSKGETSPGIVSNTLLMFYYKHFTN